MTALLVFASAGLFTCVWLLFRNSRVRDFRLALIAQIHDTIQVRDNPTFRPWLWRYECFEEVSYEEMLFSLRPLRPESFYEDTSFLCGDA